MSALNSEYGTVDDCLCGLVNVAKRGDLGEDILEVATDTGMLMSSDEGDIVACVETGELRGKARDDKAADAVVTHCNVCGPRKSEQSLREGVNIGLYRR